MIENSGFLFSALILVLVVAAVLFIVLASVSEWLDHKNYQKEQG